jgi:hypothetical protein
VFASFIARDSTFDVFINVWRQAHSRSSSVYGGDDDPITDSPTDIANAGDATGKSGSGSGSAKPKVKRAPTKCACGERGEHYPEKAMEAVVPSSPESIYNLMFPSEFMKTFMSENQKLTGEGAVDRCEGSSQTHGPHAFAFQISKCPTGPLVNPVPNSPSVTLVTSNP